MPAGRPPIPFDQQIADDLCEWIADGRSLRSFCSERPDVSKVAIWRWLREIPEFQKQYARAHDDSADADADDIGFYADATVSGLIDPAAARVAIDAKKWMAGKKRPKKYGERLELAGDAENPVAFIIKATREDESI